PVDPRDLHSFPTRRSSDLGAFAASLVGARRRHSPLIAGGIGLFHLVTAIMLVASAVIVHAFVTGDFSIQYVQRYSNSAQPLFYKDRKSTRLNSSHVKISYA